MKTILSYLLFLPAVFLMGSCHPATGSDTYDAVWSPSGNSTYSSWTIDTSSGGTFKQTAGGFQVTGMTVRDTSNAVLVLSVNPYKITNITTAREGSLSFTTQVVMDSMQVIDSSWVQHQYAKLSGTVLTRGVDSSSWSSKSFTQEGTNVVSVSVNPDSCSSKLKFSIVLQWNPFTGGTPLNTVKLKPITFIFSNVTLRVNGVSVLK